MSFGYGARVRVRDPRLFGPHHDVGTVTAGPLTGEDYPVLVRFDYCSCGAHDFASPHHSIRFAPGELERVE